MSASKDADFVLRSTWNMFTETGKGSLERKWMVEHSILCALVLMEKGKVRVKGFTSKEDQHNALKHWLEDKQTVTPNAKGDKIKAVQSSRKEEGNRERTLMNMMKTALTSWRRWWLT